MDVITHDEASGKKSMPLSRKWHV